MRILVALVLAIACVASASADVAKPRLPRPTKSSTKSPASLKSRDSGSTSTTKGDPHSNNDRPVAPFSNDVLLAVGGLFAAAGVATLGLRLRNHD